MIKERPKKLLSTNSKIEKSLKEFLGLYETTILQLLPSKYVCHNYKLCISKCLAFKGLAKVYPKTIIKARKAKTDYFIEDTEKFIAQLIREIKNQVKRAKKKGRKAVVRLNGYTDIDYSKFGIFELFPDVQFYDYCADYERVLNNKYENLHYTFSYKGNNLEQAFDLLKKGINVAVIDISENQFFNGIAEDYDFNHIDGDAHDFRWLDNPHSIIWLKEKK